METSPKVALLFDLDDTLIPSESIYQTAIETLGLSAERFRSARTEVKRRLPPKHVSARNRLLYLKTYFEAESRYSPALVLETMRGYEEILESESRKAWVSLGRPELFQRLAKRYSLGLVTNENTRTQLLKIRAIDPDAQFFKHVIISEEFGVEKPDPLLFLEALSRLRVDPSTTLFIGDSVENDIVSAKAIGMRAILTTEFSSAMPLESGVETIRKLDEIEGLLP